MAELYLMVKYNAIKSHLNYATLLCAVKDCPAVETSLCVYVQTKMQQSLMRAHVSETGPAPSNELKRVILYECFCRCFDCPESGAFSGVCNTKKRGKTCHSHHYFY